VDWIDVIPQHTDVFSIQVLLKDNYVPNEAFVQALEPVLEANTKVTLAATNLT
jgi:hypothetical protein